VCAFPANFIGFILVSDLLWDCVIMDVYVLNILGEVVYKQYVAFAGDSREEHCK
jgi:hypothetical protein